MSSGLHRYILDNHAYHTISTTLNRHQLLSNPSVAQIVLDAIQVIRRDKAFVLAYAVMPDHLHLLLVPKEPLSISQVMQSLKGFTAREINRMNHTSGSVWQQGFYDRVVRDEAQLGAAIQYIEGNPVTDGLVLEAADYRYSSAFNGAASDVDAWYES
jgi:REP element-mobilizing transposase RayT